MKLKKKQIPWNKGITNKKISGKNSPNWKGGKYVSSDGYRMIKVRDRLMSECPWKVYRREHTYVMEQSIGRSLIKGEIIHHIDKDKLNNDINNLFLTNQKNHRKAHDSLEKLAIILYKKGMILFNRDSCEYNFTEEFKKLCKLN